MSGGTTPKRPPTSTAPGEGVDPAGDERSLGSNAKRPGGASDAPGPAPRMEVVMHPQRNSGRDGAPALAAIVGAGDRAVADDGSDSTGERDVLARLAGEIDRAVVDLPVGSPWRPWRLKVNCTQRAAARLALVRLLAEGGR
jgi:hypothetical protein